MRLKVLGLIKASEIASAPVSDRPELLRAERSYGEKKKFLPGWERIAPHVYTRTVETGFYLDARSEGFFDAAHFANQRGRLKKGQGPAQPEPVPHKELSFFDLETTGLSGGAGIIAFLAAIGFLEGGNLFVTQVFIDDFPGEPAFLDFVVNLLRERPRIVSYNGAAFDIPLLRTRCVMNAVPLPDFSHIDALHTARRLWRRTLGSCSLDSIESSLLDMRREGDVPGFLIPKLWLAYSAAPAGDGEKTAAGLRAGNSGTMETASAEQGLVAMAGVAEHNLQDVRSLARIFFKAASLMREPLQHWQAMKAYAPNLALELIAGGRAEEGLALLEESGAEGERRSLLLLSKLYRRARDKAACARIIAAMSYGDFEHCLAMAKYHEHLAGDFQKALDCVAKAEALLRRGGWPSGAQAACELGKRRARLERKLERSRKGL